MVASRWPQRLPLAAAISRSTSASVRYSRVRRSALGRRLGVTVRFTVAGLTSLRCDLAMQSALPSRLTVRTMLLLAHSPHNVTLRNEELFQKVLNLRIISV